MQTPAIRMMFVRYLVLLLLMLLMLLSGCATTTITETDAAPSLSECSGGSSVSTGSVSDSDNCMDSSDVDRASEIVLFVSDIEFDHETYSNEYVEYSLSQHEAETMIGIFNSDHKQSLNSPLLSVATLRFQFGKDYLTTSFHFLGTLSGMVNGELVMIELTKDEYEDVYHIVSRYVPAAS